MNWQKFSIKHHVPRAFTTEWWEAFLKELRASPVNRETPITEFLVEERGQLANLSDDIDMSKVEEWERAGVSYHEIIVRLIDLNARKLRGAHRDQFILMMGLLDRTGMPPADSAITRHVGNWRVYCGLKLNPNTGLQEPSFSTVEQLEKVGGTYEDILFGLEQTYITPQENGKPIGSDSFMDKDTNRGGKPRRAINTPTDF